MNEVVLRIEEAMAKSGLQFSSKPILIGGMVMEYYGLRKGKDMDWIITENDYQRLAQQFPEHQKELCGDLGIEIGDFDMWRSFSLLITLFSSKVLWKPNISVFFPSIVFCG